MEAATAQSLSDLRRGAVAELPDEHYEQQERVIEAYTFAQTMLAHVRVGLDRAVVRAVQRCRVVRLPHRRTVRASRRARVVARVAAKSTSTGDPEPEPARPAAASLLLSTGGAA